MQVLRVFSETFAVVLFLRLWPVLVSLFREQAVVIICHWQFAFVLRFQRIEHELHGLFSRKGRKRFARVFKHICKRRLLIRNDFARERNLLHDPFHFGDKRILYVCDGNLIWNSTHLIISPPDRNVFAEMERRTKIARVHCHGEKSAAYMADGYARASGKPGICMAQVIGALNLAAGLRDAYLAHSPVIAMTGGRDPKTKFRKVYQEVDDVPAFEPVTKFNATIDEVGAHSGHGAAGVPRRHLGRARSGASAIPRQ